MGSKAGFLRSSRWAAEKVDWHKKPAIAEAMHVELLEQMKRGRIPVSTRTGTRIWAGQQIRAGDTARALRNRSHPLHVFDLRNKRLIFGANHPAVLFNTQGVFPRVDWRRVAKVMTRAIMGLGVEATRRDS